MQELWKKVKTEIVHQNPFWIYKHSTYEIPKSKDLGEYYYVETTGSVIIVPIFNDGRIGMIKNYRCLVGKQSIEFAGGAVGVGQSFDQAARTELQEEAGLAATELINIAEFYPWSGVSTEICRVFLARGLSKVEADKNPLEVIEFFPRRFDEIEDMIRRNEIWDGQTLAVWALIRRYLIT